MLDNRYDLTGVLALYPADCQPTGPIVPIMSGGFSGSLIWRIPTIRGPLCLRRWSLEHPNGSQLQWIHAVLSKVGDAGFTLIPLPINSLGNKSFIERDSHLWELTPWLAGEPDSGQPPGKVTSQARIAAAMAALAQFHCAVAASPAHRLPVGSALGIQGRFERLNALQSGGLDRLLKSVAEHRHRWLELALRAESLIESFRRVAPPIENCLRQALRLMVPLGPCIRDIHRQHVLFAGDQVTGIIDFGAMQPDNVACDVARLLGSLAVDDAKAWRLGLNSYGQVHPLGEEELELIKTYDESGSLLSGINWLQWIFVEGRTFSNRQDVTERFDQITARLRLLADKAGPIVV